MKRILLLTLCIIACLATATARKKPQPRQLRGDLKAGYYCIQTSRTETGFAYVGQLQMPEGFRGSEANGAALQLCWSLTSPWSIPEKPDSETARYIFRFEPTNTSYNRTDEHLYTIQNLGYQRYVQFPWHGLYLCATTTTQPECLFGVRKSERLADGFTIEVVVSDKYRFLHASRDVNSVVKWTEDELPSHWRLIPVSDDFAEEAYRIFNPAAESTTLPHEEGRICETPLTFPAPAATESTPAATEGSPATEGTPAATEGSPATVPEASAEGTPTEVTIANVLDAIVASYPDQKLFVMLWNTWDSNSIDMFERTKSIRKSLKHQGVKLVFITDETSSIYDWIEQAKELEGDHYRIPTFEGTRFQGETIEVVPTMAGYNHGRWIIEQGNTVYTATSSINNILNHLEE